MSRWLRFLIVLAFSLAAGLFYGWRVNPVKYTDTTPDSLREDYKADYVLMVAETYRAEGDLEAAMRRLALLGDDPPGEIVARAILYAANIKYAQADLAQMQALADALVNINPPVRSP